MPSMELIPSLICIAFGLASIIALVFWVGGLLMLFIPLPLGRQAALVEQLREEQKEYRRREAPMRAQMLQEQLSKEGRALLASFDLAPSPAARQISAQIVHLAKWRAKAAGDGNLGSPRT